MDSLASRHKSRKGSDASLMQPKEAAGGGGGGAEGGNAYDTTNLDKEEGNVLMAIISQCELESLSVTPSVVGVWMGLAVVRQG